MHSNKKIVYWLYSCCAAIFLMVIIGGLTRLTDSGLSIAVWKPLTGALPPLSEADWAAYFEEYKKIPEFAQINSSFGLAEFKEIFWLEYLHRLWGRVIGLIFVIPFIYFWATKQISRNLAYRLLVILGLFGVQGFMGWYMVASGLSVRTDVSQYRLAAHLIFALAIYAMTLWTAMDVDYPKKSNKKTFLTTYGRWLNVFILFMIFLGALMAGTDAGFTYNTFPMMDGRLVPSGLYALEPWWKNHFENITMIQFQHRLVGMLLAIDIITFSILLIKQKPALKFYGAALIGVLLLQIALGIATLHNFAGLSEYFELKGFKRVLQVPVLLAVAHQANAVILLTLNLIISHKLLRK